MRYQDSQVVNLFGGTYVPEGYRGRIGSPTIKVRSGRWAIAAFCAVLFGFTAVETTITLKHQSGIAQGGYISHSLPASFRADAAARGR